MAWKEDAGGVPALMRGPRSQLRRRHLARAILAVDRLLWDKLQTLVDPDYRQSFARAQRRVAKDYGQAYWWQPGATAPGGR